MSRTIVLALAAASLLFAKAHAHEHHDDKIPEGEGVSPDPLDTILWTHILVQIAAWALVFPTGMVLGIIRSPWHVPVQILGTGLAVAGYFLGHAHKGRQFAPNVHSSFAPWLNFTLFAQIVLGAYLRLHIERGFLGRIRRILVVAHGVIGKAMPVAAWVQMLFGGITALGFCRDDHLGQCAAHFIMGSAFIAYGILLTILLLVGQFWLRRTGRSQEFFDNMVIAAWGCVNTFTEHRWGTAWVRNDLQHTSMGIVWWCAGLLGVWLSRKRDGRPKRNLIPGIVILLTGYGMSAHPQELMLSTMIHSFFGYTLMAAGAARIIEISFVLRDKRAISMDGTDPNSFQYLTPFLLMASGFLFMGATEEQMALLSAANVTHVAYILILYSFAFLLFLFVNMLIHLYATHAFPETADPNRVLPQRRRRGGGGPLRDARVPDVDGDDDIELGTVPMNGHAHANGKAVHEREHRQIKDAQEFELDTLISDEEDGPKERARVDGNEVEDVGRGAVRL